MIGHIMGPNARQHRPVPPGRAHFLIILSMTIAMLPALAVQVSARSPLTIGLGIIDRSYLFGSELKAPELLGAALEYLERKIPELDSHKIGDRSFLVKTPLCRIRLELPPGSDSIVALADPLSRVVMLVEQCSAGLPETLPSLDSVLLRGVLSGLDPYSTVFDAERRTEHSIQFRGKLAGVGARIGVREDKLTLIRVYRESPAYRAGLRDDDVIRRIDGVSTTNMTVTEAVHRIRGAVGTTVRLTIERDGESELRPVSVVRDMVMIPSVDARMLAGDIVYASISHFSQTTPADFRKRVATLAHASKNVRGVVIDLRTNSGGSMLGSAAIGNLFLDDGVLITTAGRSGTPVAGLTAEIHATDDTPFRTYPVAILTSPRTASGSELLAGGLRNNDRAILVGERTFGKGTIQKTYGLGNDSALKLTVGNFLPSGRAIPGGGLTPDVQVDRYVFTGDRVRLPASHSPADLPFWLETPAWLRSVERRALVVLPMIVEQEDEEPKKLDKDTKKSDPLIELTAELLRRYGSVSAARMLADASPWIEDQRRQAEDRTAETMAAHGLDWRAAPTGQRIPPRPSMGTLNVDLSSDDGVLEAGKVGDLTVSIHNSGSFPVYRLRGKLTSKTGFLSGHGLLFGRLAPGETKSWTVAVKPPRAFHTARVLAEVELYDDNGLIGHAPPTSLAVAEVPRPRITYRVRVTPTADVGILVLRLEIANRGNATAHDIRVTLRHPENNEVEILEGSRSIEELAAGETVAVALRVEMLVTPSQPPLLDLILNDEEYGIFEKAQVRLAESDDPGPWHSPPEVQLIGYLEENDGFRLVVRVHDDSGLAWIVSRMDNDQTGYRDMRDDDSSEAIVTIPWQVSADRVQRLVVTATGRDGLRATFVTDL